MSPRGRLVVALVSTLLVAYVAVGSLLGRVFGDTTYGQLAVFNEVVRLVLDAYVEHLLSYVDPKALRPLTIVSNPGNGGAGIVMEALEPHLPFKIARLFHEPDGSFPNGIPNPLLPDRRAATARRVEEAKADAGIAWDGDFDRCFLFDERGGCWYARSSSASRYALSPSSASVSPMRAPIIARSMLTGST